MAPPNGSDPPRPGGWKAIAEAERRAKMRAAGGAQPAAAIPTMSCMETLPSDRPAPVSAASAACSSGGTARPRSGNAAVPVRPTPLRRISSGNVGVVVSPGRHGDAGGMPLRDGAARRSSAVASQVYRPRGLQQLSWTTPSRLGSADGSTATPSESGMSEEELLALHRDLKREVEQLKAIPDAGTSERLFIRTSMPPPTAERSWSSAAPAHPQADGDASAVQRPASGPGALAAGGVAPSATVLDGDDLFDQLLILDDNDRRAEVLALEVQRPSSASAASNAAALAEMEETRAELQAYLDGLKASELVDLPAEHEQNVSSIVRAAIHSGERATRSEKSWLDRIEQNLDPRDEALHAALGEMRRLDRVLARKSRKLALVKQRGRLDREAAAEVEAEEAAEREAARHPPITEEGEGADGESDEGDEEDGVNGGSGADAAADEDEDEEASSDAHERAAASPPTADTSRGANALPRAAQSPAAPAAPSAAVTAASANAEDELRRRSSPPSTAGEEDLSSSLFLTATSVLARHPHRAAAAAEGGGGALATAPATAEAPPSPSAVLDARAHADARGARSGAPAADVLIVRADDERSEPESIVSTASQLDPRIVVLSSREAARLHALQHMPESELRCAYMPEETRVRYAQLSAEIERRYVEPAARPSTAPSTSGSIDERAALAIDELTPVSRRTDALRSASEEAKLRTGQGMHDYARELRFQREAHSKLAAIDEKLSHLYGASIATAASGAEGSAEGAPAAAPAAEPRSSFATEEAGRLQELLRVVAQLATAKLDEEASASQGAPASADAVDDERAGGDRDAPGTARSSSASAAGSASLSARSSAALRPRAGASPVTATTTVAAK